MADIKSIDYGVANVRVNIYGSLPNIERDQHRREFDFGAFNWKAIKNSSLFIPMLLEKIEDEAEGFAAIFPERRRNNIDNYMVSTTAAYNSMTASNVVPFITWTPLDESKVSGVFKDTIVAAATPTTATNYYDSTTVNNYVGSSAVPPDWKGPIWQDNQVISVFPASDLLIIDPFLASHNLIGATDELTDEGYYSANCAATSTSTP